MPGSELPCRNFTPASPQFSHTALVAMRGDRWQGAVDLNDTLLTLCLLDHDLRYLTLERIRDVVAAGLQLQREAEEAEYQKSMQRRARAEAKRGAVESTRRTSAEAP